MKMRKLGLLLVLCSFAMAAMATSTPSGDKERNTRMDVTPGLASPTPSTMEGIISDDMLTNETDLVATPQTAKTTPGRTSAATKTNTSSSRTTDLTRGTATSEEVVHFESSKKEKRFRKRVEKVKNRIVRKQDGGTAIFGILALVFGALGFIIAFVPYIFFIGLLFAIAAIVLGAIGLGGGRPGRGMALAGLILGILTILIPILIVAIVLALFL